MHVTLAVKASLRRYLIDKAWRGQHDKLGGKRKKGRILSDL